MWRSSRSSSVGVDGTGSILSQIQQGLVSGTSRCRAERISWLFGVQLPFLSQSPVSPSVQLWALYPSIQTLPICFKRFSFSKIQVVFPGLTVRITFLWILQHRQDLILRRILGLRRVLRVQRPSFSSTTWTRGIPSWAIRQEKCRIICPRGKPSLRTKGA